MLELYVDAYVEERRRLAHQSVSQHSVFSKRQCEIDPKMERLKTSYLERVIELEEFRLKNAPLKLEREQVAATLAAADQSQSTISLHPKAIKNFNAAIEKFNICIV